VAQDDTRYSPPECVYVHREVMIGSPDVSKISTSYVERNNFDHANEHEKIYPFDQCFLQKSGQSQAFGRYPLHALQFLPDSQNPESDTGNGGKGIESRLEHWRNR
jgi:hypothetical protein